MNNTLIEPYMVIAQLIFGWLVKKWPRLDLWPNRLIPVFNFILGCLLKFVGEPAVAHADVSTGGYHVAWWMKLIQVLINTIVASGTYSTTQSLYDHVSKKPYPKESTNA